MKQIFPKVKVEHKECRKGEDSDGPKTFLILSITGQISDDSRRHYETRIVDKINGFLSRSLSRQGAEGGGGVFLWDAMVTFELVK